MAPARRKKMHGNEKNLVKEICLDRRSAKNEKRHQRRIVLIVKKFLKELREDGLDG